MADKNWDPQQNRRMQGYRHHYGGGYDKDPNSSYVSDRRGQAYSSYDENGYIQDVGREYTDLEGRPGQFITGARGSDYARAMGASANRDTGRGGTEGPHRGKGPRNYQRSQDRIREDVCERLTDDAMIDASNVEVRVENNEVVLNGTVHNREEKRRAEDLAEAVAGVRNVENHLRVQPGGDSGTDNYREYDEQGRIRRGS